MKKRIFALLLALVMLVGMLPVSVFAAENTVTISNAYCTITPALNYEDDTISYSSLWGGSGDIPRYTVELPSGTQTVTLTLGNSYCLTPDYIDPSIIYYYYTPLTFNTDHSSYESGRSTKVDSYTLLSATESAIELNVADLITSGSLYGVIDSYYTVQYAIEFEYAASQGPSQEDIPATGITLDKTSVTLNANINETVKLIPTITPDNTTNKTVVWSSSDPNVASVENGVVTAVEGGTATITALCGTVEATCQVTVNRPIYNLNFYNDTDGSYTVVVDSEVDAVASCTPKTTTDQIVIFESDDTDVVTVSQEEVTLNQNGQARVKLQGVAEGSATVTVASKNRPDVKDSVTVNVVSCLHTQKDTTYTHIENTETHTETVTCHNCQKQLSQTTKNCVDTDKNDKCDACDGAVCNHKETTITYQRVENEEKHTVTETCNACQKTVGTPTTENCADEDPKDGKCDKCAGDVEDTSASEPTKDENGVYQISTADQLLWFADQVNNKNQKGLSAKLTADIDLSGKTWTPMTGFAGVFDGGNKTIKNLTGTQGLFTSVTGTSNKRAEVKNVTVDGTISGSGNVGGIAGTAYYANFTNCINEATVTGVSNVGGIVGYGNNSSSYPYITLQNCGNKGDVKATSSCAGGILGYVKYNGTIEINACYNEGTVTGKSSAAASAGTGGIVGFIQGKSGSPAAITNCYNIGPVNGTAYTGGIVGSMYTNVTATNCYNAGKITGTAATSGAIAGGAYNATSSKAVNCYYLEGTASVAANNKPGAINSGTTVKTETEMKSAEMATALGSGYQTNPGGYPLLTWQTVSAGSVTYTVTKPTTVGISFKGSETAFSTEPYTFTVTINDYYRANNSFAVRINNGDPLTAKTVEGKVYTYEIAEPSADMVITVEGVESTETVIWSGSGKPSVSGYVSNIKIYDVTVVGTPVVNGNTITVTLSEDTSLTEEIRFTVGTGGAAASSMSVTPGKDFVKNLSAGVLEQTITANLYESASWNIKLQVEGVEVEYVDVEKPTSAQYTITGNDTAPKGGSYSFTLKLNSRYMANEEAFAVKANGQKLTPTNGEYTVPNVTEDIHITVEGVEMRTFSGITAGGKDVTAELQGLYTVKQGTWGSESTTPYGNVPYYKVQVPYGTQTVKITYPSYWHPISGGTQGAVTGWAYNPITLANGEPDKGTYTTYGDVAYTTNADGTHTVEVSVNNYLLKNNKGFSLLDNSLGFVDVLTFIVADCTHPAANIKTTYAATGNNTHTATQTCLLCNTQVGSITESCTDTDPKDDKCDLCKGDSTVPVVSITLSKTEAKREIGKTLQLAATILPENATDKTVTWTSSNESVATVDATGKVTAIAVGETVIAAKAGDQEATCTVKVTEVANRVSAYLSISHDADFMVGEETGTVMVLRQMEVPWFDLTPYGLEKYALPSTDAGYQKPTVLHMYIYATEVYYLGIPADEAGQGQLAESGKQQDLILPGDEPGSMYMKKFWEYDENLRYFYNYTYPAIDGWGITADRLLLSDGDVITLGHHSYWEAHADSGNGFLYFAKEDTKLVNTSVMQNTALQLQLKRSGGGMGNVTTHKSVANTDVYYVKADALTSGNVKTWTKLGTTDANGVLQATISLTPGTYYLAAAGQAGVQATDKIVSSPGAVILTVLENAENSPVRNVMDLIDAIGEVTLDQEEAITAARIAFDALDDQSLQDAVSNYSKLIEAEAKIAQLKQGKEDQDKADAFAAKVDAIGTVEATDTCKSKIDIAKAAYELLSEDQKTLAVESKAKLDKAESDYAKLIADEQDNAAADAVEAKITAIGTVSLDSEAAIKEASAAYNALSDTQKALVENIDILAAAEKKLAELKDQAAADAVEAKIEAIVEVKLDSEEDINAARTAYDGLTDAQKALVENLSVLEAAEEALELLKLAGTDIAAMYQTTGSYLAGLSAPGVGTTNGEWRVIGLIRGGKTVAEAYYNKVVTHVQTTIDKNGRLDPNKATENARLIVALTAIGKDVTDVGGYDLLSGLNDMTYIGNQGINGTIWALIAFDTHNYEIPAGNVTREKLVQAIVGKQCEDGGWSLGGVAGDPDITGMALQALAPYYQINSSVKTAVDNALVWLASIQAKDGTFTCSEGVTSESLAQVITGLTALGINPETDSRFVKNGVSAMDALSKFYLGDGTFEHGLGSGRNMMATEQAYYALVSYYRLLQGKSALYDMSDVTIVVPVYKIIEGANSDWQKDNAALTIRADGEFAKFTGVKVDGKLVDSKHYTAKAGSTVITFTTDYLKTLSEGDHTITVSFTDGEASTSVTVLPTDEEAAERVKDLIDKIGTVTENSGDQIKAAKEAYNKLTEDQKKLIGTETLEKLANAESKYEELVSMISVSFTLLGCYKHDSDVVHTLSGGNLSTWIAGKTYKVEFGATVKDVLDKALKEACMSCSNPTGNYVESINGIGEFSNGSNSGWMYTLNGTHPNLGVAQQTVKDGDVIVFHYTDDYTKEKGGMGFGEDTKIKAVEELIDAIGTVTLESEAKIAAARKAYDGLTYAQKQKVENYSKLTTAEAKYAELKKAGDEKKADAVEALIDKIDAEITLESEAEITAARKAYDALPADEKKLVDNYKKLTDAEYDLALLKAGEKDKEAAETVEKLIDAIGTVTLDSEDKLKAAREAYDKLTVTQKALVKNYEKLEKAETKLVELKKLANVANVYKTTGDYLRNLGTPAPGSVGGEWMVVGLIRSGRELKDADGYYDAVVKFVQENIDENGRLHHAKSTENSRIILALTAMGKDVTDVAGYDLLKGLNNMEYVQKQGINGPIWALIALDSGNYPAPEGDVTREALIQVILNAQLADGGWALTGTVSDPDITGMALQALAPYCDTNADVKKVVEEAIEALSMMQAADGSFASIDGTSSESVAQVIAALSALGIDARKDARFTKNDISALNALCAFFVEGGGFKHVPDGKLDGMATEQSYYALVAYFRMLDGKPALFDMTDVVDMGGDVTAEEPVETLPVETEPAPTEPVEVPTEGGRSFPWGLVIVIVVLAGAIVVLVIISKPKKGRHMK